MFTNLFLTLCINIINNLCDSRIYIYINKQIRGYVGNFENALINAKGDYIFLCDQDDIWTENKVFVYMKYLKNYDLVASDCYIINENNEIIYDSYFELRKKIFRSCFGNLISFGFLGCCLAFNSKVLKKAIPFPKKHILSTHDNWLFLVGSFFFKHKVIDEKLIYYRRHSNNVSTGGINSGTTFWFKLKYRFYLILSLIKLFRRK